MIVLPFRACHIASLKSYGSQAIFAPYIRAKTYGIEAFGPAFSGAVNGEIIGAAGLIMCHEQRAIAWALLADEARRHFRHVHRAVKTFLEESGIGRIEAYVDCDSGKARRWVEHLGFDMEVKRLPRYLPDGRDASLWVRLR